jgi:hypothetical protein
MDASHRDWSLLASDRDSFVRQESIFAGVNLLLIAALALVHIASAQYFENFSAGVIALLGAGFLFQLGELVWMRTLAPPPSPLQASALTWLTISLNTLLAVSLQLLTWGQDNQYFVLMIVPVLVAAFRLGGWGVAAIIFPVAGGQAGVPATGASGEFTPEAVAASAPDSFDLREFLRGLERALIERALSTAGGSQAEAGRKLGLSRSDVSYKLGKFGIRSPGD